MRPTEESSKREREGGQPAGPPISEQKRGWRGKEVTSQQGKRRTRVSAIATVTF